MSPETQLSRHFSRLAVTPKTYETDFETIIQVAAPVGGLLWGGGAFALRVGFSWIQAKRKGRRFDAFDRPSPPIFDEEPEESEGPGESVAPKSHTPQGANIF